MTYEKSEPEYIGKFEIRTERYEIPPDPNFKPFPVICYNGAEICLLINGKIDETPLRRREDLWVGRAIVSPALVGRYEAIVAQHEDGSLYWETAGMFGDLKFDEDDRHCWTTSMAINRRGLKVLEIRTSDG